MLKLLFQAGVAATLGCFLGACPEPVEISDNTGACEALSPNDTSADGPPTYRDDLRPLLERHCVACHGSGGAQPKLTTFADVAASSAAIAEAVGQGTLHPQSPLACCRDYLNDGALSPQQAEQFVRWHEQGAPQGEVSPDNSDVGRSDGWLGAQQAWAPTWETVVADAYTPRTLGNRDDVRCFLLDGEASEDSLISGFRIVHTSATAVRSAIYRVDEASVQGFQALESSSPEPGWDCYASLTQMASGLLGAARADAAPRYLPEATGRSFPADSRVVLLVQYATRGLSSDQLKADQPRVELRLDTNGKRVARNLLIANPYWLLDGGMPIPAGLSDIRHAFGVDPTKVETNGKPLEILGVGLQMHDRGTQGFLVIERTSGTRECLLAHAPWDTRNYAEMFLAKPVRLAPGDRILVECRWDHSDGSSDLSWSSSGELCLGTILFRELP